MQAYSPLVLFFLLVSAPHKVPGDDTPNQSQSALQEATGDLIRAVEGLQEDLTTLTNAPPNALYRQADELLSMMYQFRDVVSREDRAALTKKFEAFDKQLHILLKKVAQLGPESRSVQRAAERIEAADDELHFALTSNDTSQDTRFQVLRRQSRALAAAARNLERVAKLNFGTEQGTGMILKDLRSMAEAAELFHRKVTGRTVSSHEGLDQDFAALNQTWATVTRHLAKRKPNEGPYLFRVAERVDRVHARLFRALGIQGDRPHLVIPS